MHLILMPMVIGEKRERERHEDRECVRGGRERERERERVEKDRELGSVYTPPIHMIHDMSPHNIYLYYIFILYRIL